MSAVPKRSLFNRPAWAAKGSSAEQKQETVFGRHAVFDEVVELERQQRIKREAKAKQRSDRSSRELKLQEYKEEPGPDKKKRRISRENPEASSQSTGSSEARDSGSDDASEKKEHDDNERVTRSTPTKGKTLLDGLESQSQDLPSPNPSRKAHLIEIGDDDEDEDAIVIPKVPTRKAQPKAISKTVASAKISPTGLEKKGQTRQQSESEESEDDEYTKALKKRARERALQQPESHLTSTIHGSEAKSPSADQSQLSTGLKSPSTENDSSDLFAQPTQLDPNIVIYIQSAIPNTKPLLVNRKASQPLQTVKDYWCARQDFPPGFAATVFLTWRDTKLFNSSTMRTVLRQLKKETGFDPESGDDPSKGKIVVEAMTQELYEQKMKAKERRFTSEESGTHLPDATEVAAPPPPKKEGIVIKLTCQGVEAMPLRVRPNTSIDKIMRAFQSQRAVDATKRCWLYLDGEVLDPGMFVGEADLQDGDMIEVKPK